MRRQNRKPWAVFLAQLALVLAAMVGGYTYFKANYRIGIDEQLDRCLPEYSVYLISLRTGDLERGAIYTFVPEAMREATPEGTEVARRIDAGASGAKVLRGLPGDTVEVSSRGIFVNGVEYGKGLPLAKTLKRPKETFWRTETIPPGHYWVMGEASNSFDSRYWGYVTKEQVVGRAYPLF